MKRKLFAARFAASGPMRISGESSIMRSALNVIQKMSWHVSLLLLRRTALMARLCVEIPCPGRRLEERGTRNLIEETVS